MVHPEPAPATTTPGVPYEQMLEQIRYDGAYPTRERAEEVAHAVLAALGAQLTGDERVDLAARLPIEAALTFTAQIPATHPCTGWEFVQYLATRTGGTPATARWDTGAVLTTIAHLTDPSLLNRILAQLPTGYALLFGRAELIQAA
ncbi:DUF2267 domain-containing protein [Streptomyces sp. H10-C2]|uniref:DUF2267 domain-containing protein n=1 Tax=unclassified Streptomyces TaxID=2593676 RepID=UPI0024B981ED|nr:MULTISPECIES: DUF2267 domain-containing protein [unclassified Streptomyces]MDJ0347060.1 DUF2267 domain-containing protein [Streptomyces sp. PH10-H1]MDJ0375576.1 DUF2267 domain-containing protein [Streptomyces sp. H10-C2]